MSRAGTGYGHGTRRAESIGMFGFFTSPRAESRRGSTNSEKRSAPARGFRLVDDVLTVDAPRRRSAGGFEDLVSPRLLVSAEAWEANPPPVDTSPFRAEIPLIASLARIRSEADAALALTGVLELMARRFQIALPCGHTADGELAFHGPEKLDGERLGQAIDDSLLGIVRATDLQGGMREQVQTRIERAD